MGLKPDAIYRAIQRGELRAYKLCGRLRVDPEAVEDWKRRGLVEPRRAPLPMYERARREREDPPANSFRARLRENEVRSRAA